MLVCAGAAEDGEGSNGSGQGDRGNRQGSEGSGSSNSDLSGDGHGSSLGVERRVQGEGSAVERGVKLQLGGGDGGKRGGNGGGSHGGGQSTGKRGGDGSGKGSRGGGGKRSGHQRSGSNSGPKGGVDGGHGSSSNGHLLGDGVDKAVLVQVLTEALQAEGPGSAGGEDEVSLLGGERTADGSLVDEGSAGERGSGHADGRGEAGSDGGGSNGDPSPDTGGDHAGGGELGRCHAQASGEDDL